MEQRILSNEEMEKRYQELGTFEYPYFYKVTQGNQIVYALGTRHAYDPQDPQFKNIENLWNEFLQSSEKDNCIVLIEGGLRPFVENEAEAIVQHAEGGLITNLANKVDVEIQSPEPDRDKEFEHLASKFPKEEIIYYYFARLVAQWHRLTDKKETLEEYIERYMKYYQGIAEWNKGDVSFYKQIEFHDRTHDHQFDSSNQICFYDSSHPGKNPVAAESSSFRDQHIFSEIKRLWEEGKSIFVIYGSGHVIKLEPAVKSLAT